MFRWQPAHRRPVRCLVRRQALRAQIGLSWRALLDLRSRVKGAQTAITCCVMSYTWGPALTSPAGTRRQQSQTKPLSSAHAVSEEVKAEERTAETQVLN